MDIKEILALLDVGVLSKEEAIRLVIYSKGYKDRLLDSMEFSTLLSLLSSSLQIDENELFRIMLDRGIAYQSSLNSYKIADFDVEPLLRKFYRERENLLEITGQYVYINYKPFRIAEMYYHKPTKLWIGIEGKEVIPPAVVLSKNRLYRGEVNLLSKEGSLEDLKLLNDKITVQKIYRVLRRITHLKWKEQNKETPPENIEELYQYIVDIGAELKVVINPKDYAMKFADSPIVIKEIVNKVLGSFDDRLKMLYLALGIRIPRRITYTRFGTHIINFDKTNVGKTLGAKLVGGLIFDRISLVSLLGYATANEIKQSVINEATGLVAIDELETEKNSELYSKLLNLLKDGVTQTATAGEQITTKTWASLVFNGNVRRALDDDATIRAREFYEVLSKISDNVEALASRFALFNYYQLQQLPPDTKVDERLSIILQGFEEILGDIFDKFVRNKTFNQLLESHWEEENIKALEGLSNEITVDDVKVLIHNIPQNFRKLNVLALKWTLWEWFMDMGIRITDYFLKTTNVKRIENFKKTFFANKQLLEEWNINSFKSFVENADNLDEEFIKRKLEKMTKYSLLLLKLIKMYFEGGEPARIFLEFKDLDEQLKKLSDVKVKHTSKLITDYIKSRQQNLLKLVGATITSKGIKIEHPTLLKKALELLEEYENE